MNESAATSAPKLSPDLFGLYKQYKRDTSCLATWLVNTSHSLGYSATLPDDAAPPSNPQLASAKAPRLKGKARKDAQKNRPEHAPSSSSPHSSSSTCKDKSHGSTDIPTTSINGNQFVDFAQFISNTEPAITVPTRVLNWACRAIRGRQVCGDWFRDRTGSESSEDDTLAKSNRAHDHFTALLEQVVVILAPRVASAKAAMRSPQSTPLTGVELLESRFAALDMDAQQTAPGGDAMSEDEGDDWDVVYGLVQETLASKSHGADKRGKDKRARIPVSFGNGRVRYRVEDEEVKEWDFILELSNHLHDALEIVAFIKEHWVKYFDQSDMSLEAASITTLVGLDRLRDLHNKMMELFPALMPHHLKYGRIVTLCVRVKLHGFEPETVSPAYFTSEASKEQNESKNFSYLDMVDVIEPLRAAIHRGHVERPPPVTQAPSCTAPFPYTDSLDEIVAAFRTVLTRLYLDYRALEAQPAFCHFGYLTCVPNHLMDAFKTLETLPPTDPLPLNTLITLLVYLMIYEQKKLKDQPIQVFRMIYTDFFHALAPHLHALRQYTQYADVPRTSKMWDRETTDLQAYMYEFLFLWLALSEKDAVRITNCSPLLYRQFWNVFLCDPCIAGLLIARANAIMRQASLRIADSWQSVIYAAYVYQAGKLAGLDGGNPGAAQHGGRGSGSHGGGGVGDPTTSWWPLMDDFIRLAGADRVFFGREPTSMREAWTSLNLTFGDSGTDFVLWHRNRANHGEPQTVSSSGSHGRHRRHGLRLNPGQSKVPQPGACKDELHNGKVTVCGLLNAEPGMSTPPLHASRLMQRLITNAPLTQQALHEQWLINGRTVVDRFRAEYTEAVRKGISVNVSVLQSISFLLLHQYTPMMGFNLLLLHVQSVRVLAKMREMVLDQGRLTMLDVSCDCCRRQDDRLPSMAWNLIRTLGGDEVTKPMLGPIRIAQEKKAAVEMLQEIKEFVETEFV